MPLFGYKKIAGNENIIIGQKLEQDIRGTRWSMILSSSSLPLMDERLCLFWGVEPALTGLEDDAMTLAGGLAPVKDTGWLFLTAC